MERTLVNLNLVWRDSKGVCHCLNFERLHLLPGDKVDVRLKFTFVGDDQFPCCEDPEE